MKKVLSVFISIIILVLALNFQLPVSASEQEGITIDRGDELVVSKILEETVSTIEATIFFEQTKGEYDLGGIILGTLDAESGFSVSVESGGTPRIVLRGGGVTVAKTFSSAKLYTGRWMHLAFVIDRSLNEIRLYLDGELCDTLQKPIPDFTSALPLIIGGDNEKNYERSFSGRLKNCGIYSDVRPAEKIKTDMQALSTENAIAVWDFSVSQESFADLSLKGYDANKSGKWFATKEPVTDFDYSMVLVGDTQKVTYFAPDKLHYLYDWILDNKESKKIAYVMGLGDITDNNTETEWLRAKAQISRLDNVVPYSLIRGNHDGKTAFNKHFNTAPYNTSYQGSFDHTILNTCRKLTIGTRKYLMLALDYGPSEEVIAWADNIIKNHPDHNVIITTHVNIGNNGAYLIGGSSYYGGITDPDVLWDKLIRKHANISMVICGHASSHKVVVNQKAGDNGNIVTEMLVDHQHIDLSLNGIGMAVTLHFKNGSDKVVVETFSTIRNKYYLVDNQFEMTVHTIEAGTYSEEGLDQTLTIPPAPPPSDTEETSSEVLITDEVSSAITESFEEVSSEIIETSSEPVSSEEISSEIASIETESEPNALSSEISSSVKQNNKGRKILFIILIPAVLLIAGAAAVTIILKNKER